MEQQAEVREFPAAEDSPEVQAIEREATRIAVVGREFAAAPDDERTRLLRWVNATFGERRRGGAS